MVDETTRASEDSWNAVLTSAAASSCDDARSALAGFKAAMTDCGGPENYLCKRVCTNQDRESFYDFLGERFPKLNTHEYKEQYPLTAHDSNEDERIFNSPEYLHISKFAWDPSCSLQDVTNVSTCVDLSERFVTEGFKTAGEPLIVRPGSNVVAPIDSFSVGYVKGKARMTSLLALIHYYMSHEEALPHALLTTACVIQVRSIWTQDLQAEAFYAMQVGYRSAVRKAPSVMNWAVTLLKLKESGKDPLEVIQSWNSAAPKTDKILGGMAISVRTVLNLSEQCRRIVGATVRRHGWEASPYTNDNLSSKKLALGQSFRIGKTAFSSPWYSMTNVTEDAMVLLFEQIDAKSMNEYITFRPTKKDIERHLERCCLAIHVYSAALRMQPNLEAPLQEMFMSQMRQGAPQLEGELESVLTNREENFAIRDIKTIAEILNAGALIKGESSVQAIESEMATVQLALDKEQFEILTKEIEYDKKAAIVWYSKLTNHAASIKCTRDQWRSDVIKSNDNAAASYLNSICSLEVYPDSPGVILDSAMASYRKMKMDMVQRLSIDVGNVLTVVLLNYSTPTMTTTHTMTASAQLARYIVHESPNNIGICFEPVFAYKKGQVYAAQHTVLNQLVSLGLNVDMPFAIQFNNKVDGRDKRPMLYNGRILTSRSSDEGGPTVWQKSRLVLSNFAGPAPQLKTKDMDVIESTDPNALPKMDNEHGSNELPRISNKYSQIGEPGYSEVFKALFDGVQLTQRNAVLIVDATAKWSHPVLSFLQLQSTSPCVPYRFLGMFQDAETAEWLNHKVIDLVALRVQMKEIVLPNHQWRDLDPPVDMMDVEPTKPQLKCLVWKEPVDGVLVPDASAEMERMWACHHEYMLEYREMVKSTKDELLSLVSKIQEFAPKTRPAPALDDNPSPCKIPRINLNNTQHEFIEAGVVPGDALTDVTTSLLKSNTSLTLSLRSESKLYLMNTTEAPATINAGSALCGFGKVAFRQEGDGVPPFDSHKDVSFSPTSSADHVLLLGANNEMTYETIGRVVAAQSTQASKEKSRICYHELKEVPGDENAFELHQVIRVIARSKPKDQQGAITAASLGAIVSPAVWNTGIVALIFACQWKPTGLMPVRPLVVFKGDVTLKPGQALLLSK